MIEQTSDEYFSVDHVAMKSSEDLLQVERKSRRAAVTVALTEAQDALRSRDASVEYLVILQEKLTRYLNELSTTEREFRRFIRKDELETELEKQRTLQDRGTEMTCRLRLMIESSRRRTLHSENAEDAQLRKLVHLLELSPAELKTSSDFNKASRKSVEIKVS